MRTGDNAAAWNQRSAFQNHARPVSETRPAAAIGVVAARTIREAARARRTRMCPIAATTSSRPMRPSTVAMVPSVMSAGVKGVHGFHADQEVTLSRLLMRARVSPEQAATMVTP